MTTDVALMAEASAATGLSDFGPDDGFRASLRIVLADLDVCGRPDDVCNAMLAEWRGRLETRLRLVALRAERPWIADQVITGPLVVTGLPRTGTTALFDLIAQDPAIRAPLTWETMNLLPPADSRHWHDDPRIAGTDAFLLGLADPVADAGLHAYGATLPDECNRIHLLNFWGSRYPGEPDALDLPSASLWSNTCLPLRPYALHRQILQHLQAHGPAGLWALKEPYHINALAELVAEYPGAMIVQTHRDPQAVFPSLCGLYATIRGQGPGDPGRPATGRYVLERWGSAIRRCVAARRDSALDARIFDISQRDILSDPMGVVRAIYGRFGLPLSAEAEQRMARWIGHPAQHESRTRFTLADFDLTPDDVEDAIGAYRDGYGEWL